MFSTGYIVAISSRSKSITMNSSSDRSWGIFSTKNCLYPLILAQGLPCRVICLKIFRQVKFCSYLQPTSRFLCSCKYSSFTSFYSLSSSGRKWMPLDERSTLRRLTRCWIWTRSRVITRLPFRYKAIKLLQGFKYSKMVSKPHFSRIRTVMR